MSLLDFHNKKMEISQIIENCKIKSDDDVMDNVINKKKTHLVSPVLDPVLKKVIEYYHQYMTKSVHRFDPHLLVWCPLLK